jgi:mRNA-degrading endonuclease toxin of MazEF toxin-antitoxin module
MIRGMRGEIPLGPIRWLSKPSAVNIQGLASIGRHVLERRLGKLDKVPMEKVRAALRELLNL